MVMCSQTPRERQPGKRTSTWQGWNFPYLSQVNLPLNCVKYIHHGDCPYVWVGWVNPLLHDAEWCPAAQWFCYHFYCMGPWDSPGQNGMGPKLQSMGPQTCTLKGECEKQWVLRPMKNNGSCDQSCLKEWVLNQVESVPDAEVTKHCLKSDG